MFMSCAIIIDPWPIPEYKNFYETIVEFCGQESIKKVIVASYESGRIDPIIIKGFFKKAVYAKEYPLQDLDDEVWLLGQSWEACLHFRPMGITHLLAHGKTIHTTNTLVRKQEGDSRIIHEVTDEQFINDNYDWVKNNNIWTAYPTEKNVFDAKNSIK